MALFGDALHTEVEMMMPTIYVSKQGLASCPSCLNHIRLDADRDETICPFCEETLQVAARSSGVGSGAIDFLRNSRSGIVASALAGAGLTLTVACGDPDPDPVEEDDAGWSPTEQDAGSDAGDDVEDVEYNYTNYENIQQDYGDFANEGGNVPQPIDVGVEEDVAEDTEDTGDGG